MQTRYFSVQEMDAALTWDCSRAIEICPSRHTHRERERERGDIAELCVVAAVWL